MADISQLRATLRTPTREEVQELRNYSGCGMGECRTALSMTDSFELAADVLRTGEPGLFKLIWDLRERVVALESQLRSTP